jgi:hypothetical protein
MNRHLDIEGEVRLESPVGRVDVTGRGATVDVVLPSAMTIRTLSAFAVRHRHRLPTVRRLLLIADVEVAVHRRGLHVATLGALGPSVHWWNTMRSTAR